MKEALPFTTNNTKLAQALQLCGFELVSCWNVYEQSTLNKLGVQTVAQAHAQGSPGRIIYFFQWSNALQKALKFWDDAGKEFAESGKLHLDCEMRDVIRTARHVLDTRPKFVAMWKDSVPQFMESNGEAEDTKTGHSEGSINHPGFKLISANATRKTREHIGL